LLRKLKLVAAKEKLEIVSGAAPPPFRIFAGGLLSRNAFGLIQEYCTKRYFRSRKRGRTPRLRRGMGQKPSSRSDEMARRRNGKMGGFVSCFVSKNNFYQFSILRKKL